jgi:NAD+ kinase
MRRPPSAVRRVAVVTHGKPEAIGPALERLQTLAQELGVELLYAEGEREKHELDSGKADLAGADVAVVLGGDGTMLRALGRFLGTGIPVIGVNFGRVGFLTSMSEDELESGLRRAFAGEYRVVELPTLDVSVGGEGWTGVNDVVARSADVGRMVELESAVGGEDIDRQACDGVICSTPSGSTAYNLSNGGPVLVWGMDAVAVSWVAPHSLDARPLELPRGLDFTVANRTVDVSVTVLVDGHGVAELPPGGSLTTGLGPQRSLLATLPEVTFFRRYRETFRGGLGG